MTNNVRKLRRELEVSQETLAAAVGVSRQTIIEIEKERQEPSGSLVIKIANYFKKDPREIFFTESVV
jgi:putative transcriptional regulator